MLKTHTCSNWVEITNCIDEFPPPETKVDPDIGGVTTEAWIFRGDADSSYNLQPGIERAAIGSLEWPGLEVLVSAEFKRRARAHTEAHLIPDDELTWLALMQHYTIPTRLLDFTYSPYVALYFAVRAGLEKNGATAARRKEQSISGSGQSMRMPSMNGLWMRSTMPSRNRPRTRSLRPYS